eukprot:g7135.t1
MVDRMKIVENKNQRHVVATNDVDEGDIMLRLPRKMLITPEMGETKTRLGKLAKRVGLDELEGNMYLMMYLLESRRDEGSPFFPYCDALPKLEDSKHFPAFWDEKEREELLQGSSLLEDIDQQIELNRSDYDTLKKEDPEYVSSLVPSSEEFMWAELMVSSRAFMVNKPDGTIEHAMVPFADMLNTALPHTCDVSFGMEDDHFVMRSLHHIASGSEVRDSYGYKSTRRFLQHYGFAFFDNLDHTGVSPNVTRLKIPLRAPDNLTETGSAEDGKMLLCRKSNVANASLKKKKKDEEEMFYLDIGSAHVQSGALPDVVLSRLRLCVANDSETSFIERNFSDPNQISFVGRRNEIAATSFLVQVLERRLSEYPTTLETDREMLVADPSVLSEHSSRIDKEQNDESLMSTNQRNALIHVAAEKVILTDWLRVAALQCASANSRAPASQSDLTSFYAKQKFLGSPPPSSHSDKGKRRKRRSGGKKKRRR